jgi:hypothetical protein
MCDLSFKREVRNSDEATGRSKELAPGAGSWARERAMKVRKVKQIDRKTL